MKILFVNPFGIGDVLFTTPLVRALKEKGHSIYYWCNERVADILKYNEAIEDIFPLSRGDFKRILKTSAVEAVKRAVDLIRRLRRGRFDMALDFSLDYRYSLLLRILAVKRIIGFDYRRRGRFLTDKIKIDGFDDEHMVEHYLKLLKFIDKEIAPHKRIELFVGNGEEKWADDFLHRKGIGASDVLIGIAPGGGTSWGEGAFRKHWPKEKFAHIGDDLTAEKRYRIILFGSEEERDICDFIARRMRKNAVNLCGETTLGQLAAVLRRCKLLVTNDGGPLHMACALGVKTVSIFGPVDERVYGPYPLSKEDITIKADVECRPCYKNFRYPFCENRICLDSIEPSAVLEAARRKLG